MKQIIGITGGTGTVGKHIIPLLTKAGYDVIVLTRNVARQSSVPGVSYALWDPEKKQCNEQALSTVSGIIHLAGEPVAGKRWSAAQKKRIADSRIEGTRFLVSTLARLGRCKVFIGASAIGFYGPDKTNGKPFTEEASPSTGFLEETCAGWETEEQKAATFARTAILRIGIVLAREGGALPEFIRTAGIRVLGVPGSGKQIISWIHVDDLAAMFVYALQSERVRGIYNAVAPAPVSCRQMMDTIATEKGGIFIKMPVPAFALKIALGEMSIEVLKSTRVSADKIVGTGFNFQFPQLNSALHHLL